MTNTQLVKIYKVHLSKKASLTSKGQLCLESVLKTESKRDILKTISK